MYLIVFNIEQHYYRIFNAVYMIYEKKEGTKKMISVIKRDEGEHRSRPGRKN